MLHLVDNKTKKAVRSPRTQTLNPDGLITSSSKSSNSFSAYNLPQSDTVVNTHSMVNMKKSLLPKDRQKSPPTRPAPPQGRGQCDGGTVCGFPHRVKSEVKPVACIKVCAPRSPPNKKRRRQASFLFGGPEGIRPLGVRDANAALSQLSHGPISVQTSNSAHL